MNNNKKGEEEEAFILINQLGLKQNNNLNKAAAFIHVGPRAGTMLQVSFFDK